eukprot:COSAG04_NODE_87_length_27437_cov_64.782939_15_plen_169_part_01
MWWRNIATRIRGEIASLLTARSANSANILHTTRYLASWKASSETKEKMSLRIWRGRDSSGLSPLSSASESSSTAAPPSWSSSMSSVSLPSSASSGGRGGGSRGVLGVPLALRRPPRVGGGTGALLRRVARRPILPAAAPFAAARAPFLGAFAAAAARLRVMRRACGMRG